MALLRLLDTVDLKARTFELAIAQSTSTRHIRQQVGIPISIRALLPTSVRLGRLDPRSYDPKDQTALRDARYQLVQAARRYHWNVPRIQKPIQQIERHMSPDGTLFPPRPEFFYIVGAQDPTKWHWPPGMEAALEACNGTNSRVKVIRHWKKEGGSPMAAKMMWRTQVMSKMLNRAAENGFHNDIQREEYGRVWRYLQQKRQQYRQHRTTPRLGLPDRTAPRG